ncbi:Ras guanine nucleotide exchange factor bud5 [Tilletia horrida]|nr:Ras guanine nucleotide exchange factor bud5 [Tilletia horrida]
MAVSPVGSRASSGLAYYVGPEEYVVALHDFTSQNDTCLSFQSGQVIKVYNRDSSGWWDGELDGLRGWFPSNYVDQDGLLSTNSTGRLTSLSGEEDSMGGASSYHANGSTNAIGLRTSDLYEEYEEDYTQRLGAQMASSSSSPASNAAAAAAAAAQPPPIPRRSSSQNHLRRHGRNGSNGPRSPQTPSEFESILEPILHAIALLHNAVRANRVAHFQPSTACVISSVRSVLSATDCLTRDSAVLRAHAVLGKERKQILSELTRLVHQSKKASAVMVDESARGREMDRMLELAELVLGHVRRFLEVADECGVPIPDRRASLYEETYEDRRGGMPVVTMSHGHGNTLSADDGRSTADNRSSAYYTTFTSGQFSPRSSRSFADLRSTHSRSVYVNSHEDDAGMLGVSYMPRSEYRNTMRTTVTTATMATTAAQYHGNLSSSPPDSLHHGRSGPSSRHGAHLHGKRAVDHGDHDDDNDNDADDDVAAAADTSNDDENDAMANEDASMEDDEIEDEPDDGPAKRTPAEVLERLNVANDELLSVIAAFIGHVHTHTRQSHASSFAHLIDMTREAVDAVRNLLTVVEAVNNHPSLQAEKAKEVAILWETRESLYEATTSLVTAARVVTASGGAPPSASATTGNATPPNTEEDEKSRLLSSATGVLRTGGECVGAVRLCLGQADPGLLIAVPEPTKTRSQTAGQHSSSAAGQGGAEVDDDDDEHEHEGHQGDGSAYGGSGADGPDGVGSSARRGKHTLSFLGRKATSLSCLREKYERDGYQAAFDGILESDADDLLDDHSGTDTDSVVALTRPSSSAAVGAAGASQDSDDLIETVTDGTEQGGIAGAGIAGKRDGGSRTGSRGSGGTSRSASAASHRPSLQQQQQQQQDSSPEIDVGGNVVSTGRFEAPVRVSGEAVRKGGRTSGVPPLSSSSAGVAEADRHLSRLVLPNGAGAAEKDKLRRNSGGTSSDGDGSRVSNNSASTSAASLTGSTSLSRSARSGSEATADTSARPSLERMDSDFSSPVLDVMPHSAPLIGKFPRELPPQQAQMSASADTPSEDGTVSGFQSGIPQSASDSQIVDGTHSANAVAAAAAWARRGSISNSNEPVYMQPDYDPEDVVFKDGRLTGATLAALVEKMTPHDTTVDAAFSSAFYMCFRLFSSPMELFDAFVARFNLQLPRGVEITDAERAIWLERKVMPVRLRVFNFFKMWLESHYQEATDSVILPKLIEFTRTSMNTPTLARHGQRLAELAQRRLSASGVRAGNRGPGSLQRAYSTDLLRPNAAALAARMYLPTAYPRQGAMPPPPIIKDRLMASLRTGDWRSINIMEIDPLELARQITIMGSKIFCSIQPEELLMMDGSAKKAAPSAPGVNGAATPEQSFVKAMSALSTAISGWVNESILGEDDVRKRVQLLKFFIKLCDRFIHLNNFDALFAVHAALGSAQIDRLRQTWDLLSAKYRTLMENQRQLANFNRNWAAYRAKLRGTNPPALPFLGLFLTDLTFINDGNARIRPSPHAPHRKLLNFDRYVRISTVISDLQRFQTPYTLLEVPEMQSLLKSVLANLSSSNGIDSANDLYQRSKALEPRPSEGTLSGRGRDGGGKGLDIFNWK